MTNAWTMGKQEFEQQVRCQISFDIKLRQGTMMFKANLLKVTNFIGHVLMLNSAIYHFVCPFSVNPNACELLVIRRIDHPPIAPKNEFRETRFWKLSSTSIVLSRVTRFHSQEQSQNESVHSHDTFSCKTLCQTSDQANLGAIRWYNAFSCFLPRRWQGQQGPRS